MSTPDPWSSEALLERALVRSRNGLVTENTAAIHRMALRAEAITPWSWVSLRGLPTTSGWAGGIRMVLRDRYWLETIRLPEQHDTTNPLCRLRRVPSDRGYEMAASAMTAHPWHWASLPGVRHPDDRPEGRPYGRWEPGKSPRQRWLTSEWGPDAERHLAWRRHLAASDGSPLDLRLWHL